MNNDENEDGMEKTANISNNTINSNIKNGFRTHDSGKE